MDEKAARRTIDAYMAAFNARDMDALGRVLADDASLTDWDVAANGKAEMLATTSSIVSGAALHITVDRVMVDLPFAAADIRIAINGASELQVLDLFEFNGEGLIRSVRAFKGPERTI